MELVEIIEEIDDVIQLNKNFTIDSDEKLKCIIKLLNSEYFELSEKSTCKKGTKIFCICQNIKNCVIDFIETNSNRYKDDLQVINFYKKNTIELNDNYDFKNKLKYKDTINKFIILHEFIQYISQSGNYITTDFIETNLLIKIIKDAESHFLCESNLEIDWAIIVFFIFKERESINLFNSIYLTNIIEYGFDRIENTINRYVNSFTFYSKNCYDNVQKENNYSIELINKNKIDCECDFIIPVSKQFKLYINTFSLNELVANNKFDFSKYNNISILRKRNVMNKDFIIHKRKFTFILYFFFKIEVNSNNFEEITKKDIETFIEYLTVSHSKKISVQEILLSNDKFKSFFINNSNNRAKFKLLFYRLNISLLDCIQNGGYKTLGNLLSIYFEDVKGFSKSSWKDVFERYDYVSKVSFTDDYESKYTMLSKLTYEKKN